MWLVTQKGFYSIVQDRKDPSTVIVRSRSHKDLESLLAGLARHQGIVINPNYILNTPDADYTARLRVSRDELREIMMYLGDDVDYENFKGRISEIPDQKDRHDVYLGVWSSLRRFFDGKSLRSKKKKREQQYFVEFTHPEDREYPEMSDEEFAELFA